MRFLLAIAACWLVLSSATRGAAPPVPTPERPFSGWAQNNVHPAVVRIVAPGEGSISYGSGTLVWANEQTGVVVTNWHVINEVTGPISVHFPDGFYSLGTIQNVDRDWDLALVAIRKPPVAPVALANRAPQPGEMLTIAGYGSGHYRAASGACTQYVAPGLEFPYEMVELAVSARQGDSGGPIFNERGELAGVLFGEGHGRTSGSYCGRVRWFLSSVVPPGSQAEATTLASTPLAPVPARPLGIAAPPAADEKAGEAFASAGRQPADRWGDAIVATRDDAWQSGPAETSDVPLVASTSGGEAGSAQVRQIGWHDIAGESLGEQAKTVLAAVGVLAIVLQALRWLSREPAAA